MKIDRLIALTFDLHLSHWSSP